MDRQHSQHVAKLHRKIEHLEQEIVLSAAARMAAEEQVQVSSEELARLQRRLAELEVTANLPDKLFPPPPATSRDAAPKRREWLSMRADGNEKWASASMPPIVHVRPHVHSRTRGLSGAHLEASEDEDPYKDELHESRDDAWERVREQLRQASETTMSMAVSANRRPDSTGRTKRSVNAREPGQVPSSGGEASRRGVVLGPSDIERILALLQLLQRRIAVEKESLFRCVRYSTNLTCDRVVYGT